jgi:4-amino-4-deoxy-L-arabinose transferase-like glycosyltransferase
MFVLALSVRLAFIFTMQNGFYFGDSVKYSAAAVNLLTNGKFGEKYTRPPVYPVFLAGVYAVFGEKILAVRIVESVLGAGLAVLIAVLAARIGGAQVGALAGLLWSVYPIAVFIAGLVYPETVVTVLLVCGVLCMVTTANHELGPRRIFIGGVLFGLAALTKPVVLATIAVTILWIVYWRPAQRFSLVAVFLFGAAIPLAPWTARNFSVHGGLVIVEPRLVASLPWIGEFGQAGADTPTTKAEAIMQRPIQFAIHFAAEFVQFWELYPQRLQMDAPGLRESMHEQDPRIVKRTILGTRWTDAISILSVGPMFLFALVGAGVLWFQKKQRQAFSLLGLTILSFAVGYSFFYAKTRYRFPVEPYILILSAVGLRQTWIALSRRPSQEPVPI